MGPSAQCLGYLPPSFMNQETGNRNSREIFALFWGGADYRPKDWSGAAYKRGYAS